VRGRTARDRAEEALAAVDLVDRRHFLPRDLSGGQKQRVAIARALAGRPAVLLADEPTANLDSAVGAQILELFRELAKRENRGLLIVTHDPNVRTIADRVVKIRDGRIVPEAVPHRSPRASPRGAPAAGRPARREPHEPFRPEADPRPRRPRRRRPLRLADPRRLRIRARRCGGRGLDDRADPSRLRHSAAARRRRGRVTTYPGAEVLVSSEVAGAIVRLEVAEKQTVRKGQRIAELRSDDLRAELAEAQARVVESEAEIRLAEAERDRAQSLYDQKVDTASRRDKAVRDLEVAAARRTTALAAVTRLEAEIAKRRIVAPIDGVVLVRHVDAGESIEARAGIVTIADLAQVRIEAEVDEFDSGRLTLGSAVAITAEGFDGERWRGTVEEIPDSVQGRRLKPQDPGKPADTRVLLVKIRLDESTPLKLGQRVEVEIGG
jgi:HlyD family secretion protein